MTGVLDSIISVFEAMAQWLSSAVAAVVPMFYSAEGGLTFIGTVSIAALAISVAFLILGLVRSFLRFQ